MKSVKTAAEALEEIVRCSVPGYVPIPAELFALEDCSTPGQDVSYGAFLVAYASCRAGCNQPFFIGQMAAQYAADNNTPYRERMKRMLGEAVAERIL